MRRCLKLAKCFLFLLCLSPKGIELKAQQYNFSVQRNAPLLGAALLHTTIVTYHASRISLPGSVPDPSILHFPDNLFRYTYRKHPARISDISASLLAASPLALFAFADKQRALGGMAVCAQSVWWTWNITQTIKTTALRYRPYYHAINTPEHLLTKKDVRYSFVSGHSALSFSMATSLALAMKQLDVSTVTRNRIAVGAYALASGTAVLRVVAGKHYPTDVLAGALLGTATAYIMHRIHAKP